MPAYTWFYTSLSQEEGGHTLPDAEVWHYTCKDDTYTGWYWHARRPGSVPDIDPIGPFKTQEEAIKNARED